MTKVPLVIVSFLCTSAFAQELPRTKSYLGYSFTRVNEHD